MDNRKEDIKTFYDLMRELKKKTGGYFILDNIQNGLTVSKQGVYFFFEVDHPLPEHNMLRCSRIGTHAISENSKATLRQRLLNHRGYANLKGGNHRESVFRDLVGDALLRFGSYNEHIYKTWGKRIMNPHVRALEKPLESDISHMIARMPFLYLSVPDRSNGRANRSYIEKNAIALLSNYEKDCYYEKNSEWLGEFCSRELVSLSGLWNIRGVKDKEYNTFFLKLIEMYVRGM
jgi:hypothetical protein